MTFTTSKISYWIFKLFPLSLDALNLNSIIHIVKMSGCNRFTRLWFFWPCSAGHILPFFIKMMIHEKNVRSIFSRRATHYFLYFIFCRPTQTLGLCILQSVVCVKLGLGRLTELSRIQNDVRIQEKTLKLV